MTTSRDNDRYGSYGRRGYERDGDGLHIHEGRDGVLAHLTYGLFVLGIFTGLLSTFIGLIAAYMFRDRRDGLSNAHFNYLIDTFWSALFGIIGLAIVAFILAITIIGIPAAILVWVLFMIWYVLRIGRGWIRLMNGDYPPRV